MTLIVGNDADLISKARDIRHRVFVTEQKIPARLDLDGLDASSHHALMTREGAPVGTARLTVTRPGHAVLARVAVLPEFRGRGAASRIIDALISHAATLNLSTIEIHAHEHLRKYYESFGFVYVRDVEVVGTHQLIEMRLALASSPARGKTGTIGS